MIYLLLKVMGLVILGLLLNSLISNELLWNKISEQVKSDKELSKERDSTILK